MGRFRPGPAFGLLSATLSMNRGRMETAETLLAVTYAAGSIFGIEVGPDDNFFDLGGDSIDAIELVTRLEEVLGREIDLITLFDTQNFADFSAAITAAI